MEQFKNSATMDTYRAMFTFSTTRMPPSRIVVTAKNR